MREVHRLASLETNPAIDVNPYGMIVRMDDRAERGTSALDVKMLRYLAAIDRERSFTAAAASLGVSQPALSQGLVRLETLVGGRLVMRDARGVARGEQALTPAGKALVSDASLIVELL